MQDYTHSQKRFQESPASAPKRLGGYLVEAGLLTPAQVDVVLNDQKITGMRFGEILAARGWVKQQTVEYLMRKVVLPEKKALQQQRELNHSATMRHQQDNNSTSKAMPTHPPERRELPISKPLPSIPSDDDVSWVG